MRALILPTVALALAAAAVLAGGRMVETPVVIDEPDAEAIAVDAAASADAAGPKAPVAPGEPAASETALPPAAAQPEPQLPAVPAAPADTAHSRLVAPAVVAPPDLAGELEREAPREPLSQLGLALPPQPEIKNEWAGTPLFRPLAVESAVFQSGSRTVALSGVKSVPLDESCAHEGVSWPCGVRARTAFRLWLRGRALVCQLPDEEHEVTRARCRLAKQDAGAWLVANGWALADPEGPYVQAEEKARAAKMGIFGAPPDASSISEVPDAPDAPTGEGQPIMTEDGVDPQPALDAGPLQAFPPAPPQP